MKRGTWHAEGFWICECIAEWRANVKSPCPADHACSGIFVVQSETFGECALCRCTRPEPDEFDDANTRAALLCRIVPERSGDGFVVHGPDGSTRCLVEDMRAAQVKARMATAHIVELIRTAVADSHETSYKAIR